MRRRDYVPPEHAEQVALMRWAVLASGGHPELRWLYANPNGGERHPAVAARLKAEGTRKGIPDLHLPVMRGGYGGLWIELKRQAGGRVSPEQRVWLAGLNANGHRAVVCKGWAEARDVILDYLGAKV